uniref:Putative DNA packaging protein n=2 Tax=viral metagenome TaxID=1070528 RepID=A0A6M3IL73_9ZZZZ
MTTTSLDLSDSELRRLAHELTRREKYQRDNPLVFARLNDMQRRFMDVIGPDGGIPKRIINPGPNKGGKTTLGALRGVSLALGEHPFLPDDHPLRRTSHLIPVPNQGLVVGETLTQHVDQKLAPEYLRWIPKKCNPRITKNTQKIVTRIDIEKDLDGKPLGSTVFFRSYESPVASFESLDYHWNQLDEPPPHDHWVAMERGLVALNGVMWITMTSLKEPWIKDVADSSVDYGGTDPNIRVVEGGDIWRNSIKNGGFLDPDAIQAFVDIVPEEERGPRIYGLWMNSGSVIYSSFEDQFPYVVPTFTIPDDWTWYEALDPADAKPTRWIFAAIAPYDIRIGDEKAYRIFVADTLTIPAATSIKDMVEMVRKIRAELGYSSPQVVIIDAKYGRRRATEETSDQPATWQDKLEAAGIGYVVLSQSNRGDVSLGHSDVRDYLRPQYWATVDTERPGICFMDRCRKEGGIIQAMLRYRYKARSSIPEEKYKDWADPVRYLCMYRPTHIPRESWNEGMGYIPSNPFTGR